MDNRIGAQFYTLRKCCKTLEDFDESCRKVSEIGYKVVQLSGIGDFSADEIKTVLDKYGLIVEEYVRFFSVLFNSFIGIAINGITPMKVMILDILEKAMNISKLDS